MKRDRGDNFHFLETFFISFTHSHILRHIYIFPLVTSSLLLLAAMNLSPPADTVMQIGNYVMVRLGLHKVRGKENHGVFLDQVVG